MPIALRRESGTPPCPPNTTEGPGMHVITVPALLSLHTAIYSITYTRVPLTICVHISRSAASSLWVQGSCSWLGEVELRPSPSEAWLRIRWWAIIGRDSLASYTQLCFAKCELPRGRHDALSPAVIHPLTIYVRPCQAWWAAHGLLSGLCRGRTVQVTKGGGRYY